MSDGRGDPQELRKRLARSIGSPIVERVSDHTPSTRRRPAGSESSPDETTTSGYISVKADLQKRLLSEIGDKNLVSLGDDAVADAVEEFVADVLETEDLPLNEAERGKLAAELTDETLGVGPLAPLLGDPAVTDILVNAPDQIFVERFGRLEKTEVRFRDAEHILRVIERLAARLGRRIDASSPMVDLRLPDGSRVNATIPPVSIDGPTVSIRRFGRRRLRRTDLARLGMFTGKIERFLELAVTTRKNVLISGGTGVGKSTFLGAIAETIPFDERIVTIEDTAELILDQSNVVRLEARPANVEGRGEITQRELVRNSLRMRPDRIVVGEVRGGEALDMLQAMNTGHEGSMCTIHANSTRDALSRLETLVLMAGFDLPSRAIREQIGSALDYVVHLRRYEDGVRRVESVSELTGLEGETLQLQEIFRFERGGRHGRRIEGDFVATGIVPRLAQELQARGHDPHLDLYHRPAGRSDG